MKEIFGLFYIHTHTFKAIYVIFDIYNNFSRKYKISIFFFKRVCFIKILKLKFGRFFFLRYFWCICRSGKLDLTVPSSRQSQCVYIVWENNVYLIIPRVVRVKSRASDGVIAQFCFVAKLSSHLPLLSVCLASPQLLTYLHLLREFLNLLLLLCSSSFFPLNSSFKLLAQRFQFKKILCTPIYFKDRISKFIEYNKTRK